ncbi:MAG: tail fiber domain-containing protein, partial [bacterium]|nr:tail fiber domain-containing protein [bacterium]
LNTTNILANASAYLNFGTTEGTTGYGIRDNFGTIQIKNSGGDWVNMSTASTSIVNQYASGGTGTQANPWTGWESSVNSLAENSEIFFPAGYYQLDSPIIVKAGWRISGAGVDSTRIILADEVNDSIFKSASDPVNGSYVWSLTIEDLYLDGNKANNSSGKGVYGSFWHLKIYRTKFKNFAENGINLIAGTAGEIWENFLIDVYVEASDGDNIKIETGVNDGEIIRLVSRDSAANGIHLNSVGGWKITNSHFYYNQVGVRLKDSSKTTVNNSEIETNKTIGLQINGSGGNQVVGNSFYRNSCPSISSNVCSGYGSYSHMTIEWSNNNGVVGNNFYKYSSEPNFTKYIIEEQGTSDSNYISDNTYVGYDTGDFLKVGSNTVFSSNFNGETNSVTGVFSNVAIGTTSPQRKLHVYRSDDGAPVRFEDANGYCEIDPTSTSWTCTSDRSLKKDITNLASSDSLSKLSLLQAVNFRWLNQDSEDLRYGFIAQDVESVFPDFVKVDERNIKTVNYGGFTPIMIDAIKELNLKVTDLEAASNASGGAVSDSLFTWILKKFLGIGIDFSQDKIKVKNICVGETCVTEDQFRAVFGNQQADQSSLSAGETDPSSSVEEPIAEPEPVEESVEESSQDGQTEEPPEESIEETEAMAEPEQNEEPAEEPAEESAQDGQADATDSGVGESAEEDQIAESTE